MFPANSFEMFRASILLLVATHSCAIGLFIPVEGTEDPYGGRIVGGSQITIAQAPWQASLRYAGSHFCGGAVLSTTAVVTAAHCLV